MNLSKLLHVMSKGVQNTYLIPIAVGGSSEKNALGIGLPAVQPDYSRVKKIKIECTWKTGDQYLSQY